MSKETEQTTGKEQEESFKNFLLESNGYKKAGKITLAMLRKAMRERGLPAGDAAEGAKQLAAKTAKALSEGFTDYRKASASMDALMEKQYLNEAEKQRQKQDAIMGKLHKLQFIHDALQRIVAKQSTEVYWNKKGFAMLSTSPCEYTEGFKGYSSSFHYYPWEALQLKAFEKILPKTQEAEVVIYTEEVKFLPIACKQEPRIVEGKPGGLFEEEVPSGKYYDVVPNKKKPDEVMSFIFSKETALNSRMFPLLVFFLSLFYKQNKRFIRRRKDDKQKTQAGDIERKFTLKYADVVKRFPFKESKASQYRAKQMIQCAAGALINMRVDYRYTTKDGVPMRRVTNIFDEVESECGDAAWLTVSFSEAYAQRLVKEADWVMFWGPVLKLRPDHVAPFLIASAKSIPSDGSRWRTSDLQEIARYLGSEEGDKIHDSFYEDVVQRVHDFIRDAEDAGLASFRFMRRMKDKSIVELTNEQAEFIEGREKKCDVRHNWNDLDGIVLQAKILDLPGEEKSIEEDEKRAIEARRKKRKEESAS